MDKIIRHNKATNVKCLEHLINEVVHSVKGDVIVNAQTEIALNEVLDFYIANYKE